jgi:beta-N-acetylhexosaminidase
MGRGRSVGRPLAYVLALAAVATLLAFEDVDAAPSNRSDAPPTTAQLVGQKLVVSMQGTHPSRSLLARARHGRIGGVLIHGFNFTTATQLETIARRLQRAAAEGGQPPLLIAVDQEGGPVKTIPWIPPTLSPAQMGAIGSSEVARRQGRRTGVALRGLGVNTDFAPVADVPVSRASFLYQQRRTWSFSARRTARLSSAFAVGLGRGGALATMKHFPGLGYATLNTDTHTGARSPTGCPWSCSRTPSTTPTTPGMPPAGLARSGPSSSAASSASAV